MEYYAVPKGGNALTSGIKLGRGPRHSTLQTVQYDESGVPNPIPAIPSIAQPPPAAKTPAEDLLAAARTDALTKQPLDLEAEEETRKLETSRWLDSHFGSESSYETTEGAQTFNCCWKGFSKLKSRTLTFCLVESATYF